MHQNRNRLGVCPTPHWGSSRRSPRPTSRMGRGHPLPIRHPLGTFGASTLETRDPCAFGARSVCSLKFSLF